jgi:hypothetical protein
MGHPVRLLYKKHRFYVSIVAADESDWNERRNDPLCLFSAQLNL